MVVPCDTLVINPVASTVAIDVLLLLHVPFVEVLSKLTVLDPLSHIGVLPLIAAGVTFTVTVASAAVPQPLS